MILGVLVGVGLAEGVGLSTTLTTGFLTTAFLTTGFLVTTDLGAGFFTAEKEVVGSKRVKDSAQTTYFFIILTSWPWLYLPLHLSKEQQ
jgi:hypothetical protein